MSAECPFQLSGLPSAIGTSDGLLFARVARNTASDELTKATGATISAAEIRQIVSNGIARLDVDDSGKFDLNDASIIVRHLLGFRDEALVVGKLSPEARRTKGTAIQAYIDGGCIPVRFTVGGGIDGLAVEGLVLDVNRAETLSVPAGATRFTMPRLFLPGDRYEVRVRTQPAGFVCSVSKASGIFGEANVSDVSVLCSPTYTIGGTISGLSASGLVLRNNGTGPTAIAAGATSFTVPGAFPSGGTYSITVSTQPSGLTCSVANGSGMIGTTNVTNVQISCAITTYTIGGTIDFLFAAGGLILQNNGGADIPIAAGTTDFVIPGSFPPDTPYSVTIKSQPLGRTCAISNGSGTVALGNVTNIRLSCCGNSGQRLLPGGRSQVGYSGACDGSCPQACAAFNFDCCSNQNFYAGVCANNGGGAGVALCDCTCN